MEDFNQMLQKKTKSNNNIEKNADLLNTKSFYLHKERVLMVFDSIW